MSFNSIGEREVYTFMYTSVFFLYLLLLYSEV